MHNILEVNVNIALKKIPLVYIRPFKTHFFGVGTFNVEKCHWFKNANYLKKKMKIYEVVSILKCTFSLKTGSDYIILSVIH